MTSNPGTAGAVPTGDELRRVLGLELLNRVDEVVPFRPLDPDDVEMIVGRALADLTSAVERRHQVKIRVTPEAARFAAQQAAQSAPGARSAKRTVERLVHGPLGALVLTGKTHPPHVMGRGLHEADTPLPEGWWSARLVPERVT
jgi:ATP-dependent Clp protease ATP-binding subunit ClpA